LYPYEISRKEVSCKRAGMSILRICNQGFLSWRTQVGKIVKKLHMENICKIFQGAALALTPSPFYS